MARCQPFDHGKLPQAIYFDTSFLVLTVLGGQDKRWEARQFLRRLLNANTFVIISDLVILECAHAAVKSLLIDEYGKDEWHRMAEHTIVRRRFMPKVIDIMSEIDKVIALFVDATDENGITKGEVVRLDGKDISQAVQNMKQYALMSYDATHLAVMQSYGTQDVATTDADFLDVDSLALWLPVAECMKLRKRT